MSFILDALKKSENERQRQTGPSLADITVIRRRNERPWWAFAVGALLALNLMVLVVVLMRNGDAKPTAPIQQQQAAPAPQTYAAPAPPPAQTYQAPAPSPTYQGHVATDPSVRSLADEAGGYEAPYPTEQADPNLTGAAAVPRGQPTVRRIEPPAVQPLPAEARARASAPAPAATGTRPPSPTARPAAPRPSTTRRWSCARRSAAPWTSAAPRRGPPRSG